MLKLYLIHKQIINFARKGNELICTPNRFLHQTFKSTPPTPEDKSNFKLPGGISTTDLQSSLLLVQGSYYKS